MNNRWFGLACIGLMVLSGLWALPQLPASVLVHWDMQGQPDGFASAWIAAFLMPAVSIGATHSIAGVGPKVGDWPLIPGHMGIHNWEYVTRAAR